MTKPNGASENELSSIPDEPVFAHLFAFRFLGMGLIFTWDWCIHGTNTLILDNEILLQASNSTTFIALAEATVLILLAIFSRTIGSAARKPRIAVSGYIAGLAGTSLLIAYSNAYLESPVWFALGGLLVGFTNAILIVSWAEVYTKLTTSQSFLYGACSLVFAVCFYSVANHLIAPWGALVTICVPIISLGLCFLSSQCTGKEDLPYAGSVRYTFPWKPVAIMGVCGFTAAFVDVALFNQGTTPHILADLIVGGTLVMAIVILRISVKPVVLVGAAITCVVVGVLSVALFGEASAFAASLLTMTSYVVITFFTYALLVNICRLHGVSSLWLFGFAAAARTIMDHIGGFASLVFPDLHAFASSPLDLAIMAAIGLVAIGAISLIWMSERSFNTNWAIQTINIHDGKVVHDPRAALVARCEQIAHLYGITAREEEILELLVGGYTYQQISQNLLVSTNTVKTHTRHIYAKLDVHTREEALAIINAIKPD